MERYLEHSIIALIASGGSLEGMNSRKIHFVGSKGRWFGYYSMINLFAFRRIGR
jgi:hypothetical protein